MTDGAIYVATDTGTMWLGTSSTALLQIKDNIDTNTTYTLAKSGSSIQLKNQAGTVVSTITDANTTYNVATTSANGLMSKDDKSKLDNIEDGAQANQLAFSEVAIGNSVIAADSPTTTLILAAGNNVTLSPDTDNLKLTISASNTTYGDASQSSHGLMSAADKKKLDTLATVATSGSYNDLSDKPTIPTVPSAIKNPNALTISLNGNSQGGYDGSAAKSINVTANSVGAVPNTKAGANAVINLLDTGNAAPTDPDYIITQYVGGGTQNTAYIRRPMSAIWTYIKGKADSAYQAKGSYAAASHNHSAADITSGTLDIARIPDVSSKVSVVDVSKLSGQIAAANLPSYVDDVLEYESLSKFPTTGETGKIYTATDTNKIYRWSGSAYVVISDTLALGTTHASAGYGDESRAAYDHSNVKSGNPHGVTKSDVGLGNVENKSSATIRGELTKTNVTTALGYTPPTTNTTYGVMGAATSSAAGTSGLVPAPAAGKQASFLRGDGTWVVPTNTTYGVATSSANGLMSSGDKSKLDGIATGANNYSHPTTSGNKHIPSGGQSGQILRWSADGTATWGWDNNTWTALKGATTDAAGTAGYAPAPAAGAANRYLRSDGTWSVPPDTNTTYSAASQSAAGLMSAADKKKLDGIATGANNYTYTLPTATSSVLGGVKTGSNITNSSGTISITKANVVAALGYTPPTTNTTYAALTDDEIDAAWKAVFG